MKHGFQVGDIVEGLNTGRTYEVVDVLPTAAHDRVIQCKYLAHGLNDDHEFREKYPIGHITQNHPSKLRLISRANPQPQPTKKESDMDNKHLNNAINALAAEEAADSVRPVFTKTSKLVRGTDAGQAIVLTSKDHQYPKFFSCTAAGRWVQSDNMDILSTEGAIAAIVAWRVEYPKGKVARLTKEK